MASLDSLQSALDYRFRDPGLLERALTRPLTPIEWNEADNPAPVVDSDDGDVETVITH